MAWKRTRRRKFRRPTQWFPPPLGLAKANEGEQVVREIALERLAYDGTASLTWAATPEAMTDVQENSGSLTAKSLIDESTLNTTTRLLRVVGHLRPVAAFGQFNNEFRVNGAEVRYAFVRGDRPGELGSFESTGPSPTLQPDLFNGFHLASERIAHIVSFVLCLTDPQLEETDALGFNFELLKGTQWFQNPALSYLDWKSSRRENEDSGMYLLRQIRLCGEVDPALDLFTDAKLFDASYARVLRARAR